MIKSKLIAASIICSILQSTAYAGLVQPQSVDVDLTARVANGDMITARYADEKGDFIGCGIRKISDGAGGIFEFGFCQAEDAKGERIICTSQDAGLLDAISSSNDNSFVTFSWNENDECTRIGFSNQSFYYPKGLDSNE